MLLACMLHVVIVTVVIIVAPCNQIYKYLDDEATLEILPEPDFNVAVQDYVHRMVRTRRSQAAMWLYTSYLLIMSVGSFRY